MKKQCLVFSCMLITVIGCQTPNEIPLANYNRTPDQKFPAITIVVNKSSLERYDTAPDVDPYKMNIYNNDQFYDKIGLDKSDIDLAMQVVPVDKILDFDSQNDSGRMGEDSVQTTGTLPALPSFDPTEPVNISDKKIILKQLRRSGMFERVDINNAHAETVLHINLTVEPGEPLNIKTVGKLIVSIGSLFCLPVPFSNEYSMSVDVYRKGHIVRSYQYEDTFSDCFLIFDIFDKEKIGGTDGRMRAVEILLSRFYLDLQTDEILDGRQ